uniref:(northern house mosquito) hypothetical protein n=1 Tax=Culex pipiens TaxID=7175 RepID=A0A8D8GKS4_CULPI
MIHQGANPGQTDGRLPDLESVCRNCRASIVVDPFALRPEPALLFHRAAFRNRTRQAAGHLRLHQSPDSTRCGYCLTDYFGPPNCSSTTERNGFALKLPSGRSCQCHRTRPLQWISLVISLSCNFFLEILRFL